MNLPEPGREPNSVHIFPPTIGAYDSLAAKHLAPIISLEIGIALLPDSRLAWLLKLRPKLLHVPRWHRRRFQTTVQFARATITGCRCFLQTLQSFLGVLVGQLSRVT